MLKTLQVNNKVIGMYLSDHANIYQNGDGTSKSTFITSEFSNYIPVMDFLEINHRKEVTFANGVNKNEEIVTYNKGVAGRNFSEAVIRRGNIDVSVNDLFVGPITLFLNFTQYNLTVVTNKEFRKTFVPIENSHLEDFKGKIVVMNLHTINTPKSILNITGCTNYLDILNDRFKNRNAPNIEEMKEVLRYANEKWGETKFVSTLAQSNSLKVATMIELSEAEFMKDKTDTIFLSSQDIMITLDSIVEAQDHPATTNTVLSNRDVNKIIRNNSYTCFIVDNEDKLADRYINIAGVVKKISKVKNHNIANGLYIITTDTDGKALHEAVCNLDEIDSNKYVYRSFEEANIGADVRVQYKDNVETARVELESNKIDKMNEGLEFKALFDVVTKDADLRRQEHAAELERVRNELKLVTDMLKVKDEKEVIQEKRRSDRIKANDEERQIHIKRDYDSFRYDLDRKSHHNKVDYEETKYQRDSFVEGLKTVGAVAGIIATGYVVYNKFASAK